MPKKHKVKCKICGKVFDTNIEPTVKVSSTRYAHKNCYENYEKNKTKEDRDNEALEQYILKLFSIGYLTQKIKNQIENYKITYGYTAEGILKALKYWFEVRHGDIEKTQGGIGIVPYIWDDAQEYYNVIERGNALNENVQSFEMETKQVLISYPQRKPMRKNLFSFIFEDEEEINEE